MKPPRFDAQSAVAAAAMIAAAVVLAVAPLCWQAPARRRSMGHAEPATGRPAEPRVLMGRRFSDGRTLVIIEEAVADKYDPDDSDYRCSLIVMSADAKTATVAWSGIGKIQAFGSPVKPFDVKVWDNAIVMTYGFGLDVCAQVLRQGPDGRFTRIPGGGPIMLRDSPGVTRTTGMHIDGDIKEGTLLISVDQLQYEKDILPSYFKLITRDGHDAWAPAFGPETRPATRPTTAKTG